MSIEADVRCTGTALRHGYYVHEVKHRGKEVKRRTQTVGQRKGGGGGERARENESGREGEGGGRRKGTRIVSHWLRSASETRCSCAHRIRSQANRAVSSSSYFSHFLRSPLTRFLACRASDRSIHPTCLLPFASEELHLIHGLGLKIQTCLI